jgi:hypothetical protein
MLSIIIPHRNRSALIAETLRSLEEQTMPEWEALVVDHDSEPAEAENLARLVTNHPRAKLLTRRDGPPGPSASRNLGLHEARGAYVIFLDSDDLLAPFCLERRVAAATAHPDADLWVFPSALFRNVPGDSGELWNRMVNGEDDLLRFLRSDGPWCVTSPMWRREALVDLGGFNEAVLYGDDAELHIHALLAGLRPLQYPEAEPDVFIRRSEAPRITQGNRPELVESRFLRLQEITRLLQRFAVPESREEAWRAWEGQYFVEAEHLLFHYPKGIAGPAIARVLATWKEEFSPGLCRKLLVRTYLTIAHATRERAYLVLRIARRIAKPFLPNDFFT